MALSGARRADEDERLLEALRSLSTTVRNCETVDRNLTDLSVRTWRTFPSSTNPTSPSPWCADAAL